MATKKSSTKAKTKTTKKSSAAKATSKTTPISPSKAVNIMKLRSLHIMSVGIFILLAILAGMFMGDDSRQLTIGYLTKDILATDQTVLAPAARVIFDVEVRWLLAIILVLSAVLPLLYLTKLEKRYTELLSTGRVVPLRWVNFAVTGALMTEVVALLSGVQDIMVLKLIAGLMAIAYLLSWIAEWHYKFTHPAWRTYAIAIASAVLPWIVIAGSAVATIIYGSTSSPWYVYALYAVMLASIFSIFCIQFTDYRHKKAAWEANYLIVERNYLAVDILTKTAFGLILIVGLLK